MNQVKNEKKNDLIVSIIISVIFMVICIIVFTIYRNQFKAEAEKYTKSEMAMIAKSYATMTAKDITAMAGDITVSANLLQDSDIADNGNLSDIAATMIEGSNIDKAWIINANDVSSDISGMIDSELDEQFFFIGTTDGESDYLVYARTFTSKKGDKYVVAGGYSVERFVSQIKKKEFDTKAVFMIVDEAGTILAHNDVKSNFLSNDNLWDCFDSDNYSATRLKKAVSRTNEGMEYLSYSGEERLFASEPVIDNEILQISVIVAVNRSHIDKQIYNGWDKARAFLTFMGSVCAIFAIAQLINILSDRFKNRQDKRTLENKADTDLLTGLNNKLATERKIKEYIEENPQTPGLMMLFDVDDFKKINDTKGHAFGDEVLRELGGQLGGLFRYTDVVGRIGGDEFMVFLKNIEGDEVIQREAKKIIQFFDSFTAGTEYIKYSATASIGVAQFPLDGADFESLYKSADKALYKSKENGKDQLNFCRDDWEAVKA